MFVDKAIQDRSKDYMNARRVAKEFEVITRGLNRNAPAVPPQSAVDEIKQVELWKKYIGWEKSNPLKTEDITLVIKRGLSIAPPPRAYQFNCYCFFFQWYLHTNNVFFVLAIIPIYGTSMLRIWRRIAN